MSSNSNDKNNLLLNHIKNINKSDVELEQLKKENQVLKEENLKLKTEMTIKNESIPHNNNTSSNFFLISQIEQIWIEIGENNINECFVDYYSYPDILHEIICKIVNIIQSMISNTTSFQFLDDLQCIIKSCVFIGRAEKPCDIFSSVIKLKGKYQ